MHLSHCIYCIAFMVLHLLHCIYDMALHSLHVTQHLYYIEPSLMLSISSTLSMSSMSSMPSLLSVSSDHCRMSKMSSKLSPPVVTYKFSFPCPQFTSPCNCCNPPAACPVPANFSRPAAACKFCKVLLPHYYTGCT